MGGELLACKCTTGGLEGMVRISREICSGQEVLKHGFVSTTWQVTQLQVRLCLTTMITEIRLENFKSWRMTESAKIFQRPPNKRSGLACRA